MTWLGWFGPFLSGLRRTTRQSWQPCRGAAPVGIAQTLQILSDSISLSCPFSPSESVRLAPFAREAYHVDPPRSRGQRESVPGRQPMQALHVLKRSQKLLSKLPYKNCIELLRYDAWESLRPSAIDLCSGQSGRDERSLPATSESDADFFSPVAEKLKLSSELKGS